MWQPFNEGKTIGAVGSENGTIVLDDEHSLGARITLERETRTAPFAITCGIYELLVHTRFFSHKEDAAAQFEAMKIALAEIIESIPLVSDPEKDAKRHAVYDSISAFLERYP